jgi:hypothetical protein
MSTREYGMVEVETRTGGVHRSRLGHVEVSGFTTGRVAHDPDGRRRDPPRKIHSLFRRPGHAM